MSKATTEKVLRGYPIRELLRELTVALREQGLEGEGAFENIQIMCDPHRYSKYPTVNPVWPIDTPHRRYTAVYPVRGSNEGWYAHIDALSGIDPSDYSRYEVATHIGFMKVLDEEMAYSIARATARLLEGYKN